MMSYFGLREWEFENSNIDRLASEIRSQHKFQETQNPNGIDDTEMIRDGSAVLPEKLSHLEFDMKTINWNEYFHHYLYGIKKYVFKEKDTKTSKTHYSR